MLCQLSYTGTFALATFSPSIAKRTQDKTKPNLGFPVEARKTLNPLRPLHVRHPKMFTDTPKCSAHHTPTPPYVNFFKNIFFCFYLRTQKRPKIGRILLFLPFGSPEDNFFCEISRFSASNAPGRHTPAPPPISREPCTAPGRHR